jgi:hypothetical protein
MRPYSAECLHAAQYATLLRPTRADPIVPSAVGFPGQRGKQNLGALSLPEPGPNNALQLTAYSRLRFAPAFGSS